jgi:hypothetical protein
VERRTEEGERRNKMTKGGRERKSLELGCTVYSTNQERQGKKKNQKSQGGDGGPAEENKGKHGRELNKTKQGEDAMCEKCEEEEKKRRESEV